MNKWAGPPRSHLRNNGEPPEWCWGPGSEEQVKPWVHQYITECLCKAGHALLCLFCHCCSLHIILIPEENNNSNSPYGQYFYRNLILTFLSCGRLRTGLWVCQVSTDLWATSPAPILVTTEQTHLNFKDSQTPFYIKDERCYQPPPDDTGWQVAFMSWKGGTPCPDTQEASHSYPNGAQIMKLDSIQYFKNIIETSWTGTANLIHPWSENSRRQAWCRFRQPDTNCWPESQSLPIDRAQSVDQYVYLNLHSFLELLLQWRHFFPSDSLQ